MQSSQMLCQFAPQFQVKLTTAGPGINKEDMSKYSIQGQLSQQRYYVILLKVQPTVVRIFILKS